MVEVAEILSEEIDGIRFAIPIAPSVSKPVVERIVQRATTKFSILSDGLDKVLHEATLVITASGTVTLEAAIAGTPMVIIYKVSPLSYWFAKRMIRVKHIGLANLVAEKPLVPELIQHQASAEKIAQQALEMIKDEKGLAQMRLALRRVTARLGVPGASKRAAEVAMVLLSED
jgi:lipid-A-disaccharide synthase